MGAAFVYVAFVCPMLYEGAWSWETDEPDPKIRRWVRAVDDRDRLKWHAETGDPGRPYSALRVKRRRRPRPRAEAGD
jgi:hypothetical protein